jgi:hypothetical protein
MKSNPDKRPADIDLATAQHVLNGLFQEQQQKQRQAALCDLVQQILRSHPEGADLPTITRDALATGWKPDGDDLPELAIVAALDKMRDEP